MCVSDMWPGSLAWTQAAQENEGKGSGSTGSTSGSQDSWCRECPSNREGIQMILSNLLIKQMFTAGICKGGTKGERINKWQRGPKRMWIDQDLISWLFKKETLDILELGTETSLSLVKVLWTCRTVELKLVEMSRDAREWKTGHLSPPCTWPQGAVEGRVWAVVVKIKWK